MARKHQAGFTLIEIMLVLAIGSMLLVIVFAGQRGVRAQAAFDAAVTKVVASIADARNEATAAVNVLGNGDGSDKCAGGPDAGDAAGQRYFFAGTVLTADNALAPRPLKMTFYKAKEGATACSFDARTIDLSSDLTVSANYVNLTTNPPTVGASIPGGARVLYVRTNAADLAVCLLNLTGDETLAFRDGGCSSPAATLTSTAALRLTFSDADGHVSHVDITPSGLALRRD